MQANRNIRRSIYEYTKTKLTNLGFAYIYTEAQMRSDITPNSSGSYVYLVDSMTKPMATTLPFIVLEVQNIDAEEFEMGNRSGKNFDVFWHVFGKSRGQRDDIACYLQEHAKADAAISYYDYSSGSGITMGFPIQIMGKIRVVDSPPPDKEIQEYSLANWAIVSFSCAVVGTDSAVYSEEILWNDPNAVWA